MKKKNAEATPGDSKQPPKSYTGVQKMGHAELRVWKWKKQQYGRNKSRMLRKQSKKKKTEEIAREDEIKAADRKMVEGMLKAARKDARNAKDDPGKLKRVQKKIRKLLLHLEYTNCFPEGERYIPLFDDDEGSNATKMGRMSRRKDILASIKKDLASIWISEQDKKQNEQLKEVVKNVIETEDKHSTEARDDFFLYSDEDDHAAMVPAQPLTAADLQKKAKKRLSKDTPGTKEGKKVNKRHPQQQKQRQRHSFGV